MTLFPLNISEDFFPKGTHDEGRDEENKVTSDECIHLFKDSLGKGTMGWIPSVDIMNLEIISPVYDCAYPFN